MSMNIAKCRIYVEDQNGFPEVGSAAYMKVHEICGPLLLIPYVAILDLWDNKVMRITMAAELTEDQRDTVRRKIEAELGLKTFNSIQDYIKSLKD